MAIKILMRYKENNTHGACSVVNMAAMNNTKTCKRAEHNENGMVSMVRYRSPLERMTLVPKRAGTLQPKPMSNITKLRPSMPNFDIRASIKNAALER